MTNIFLCDESFRSSGELLQFADGSWYPYAVPTDACGKMFYCMACIWNY